uniref:Zgc:113210 n=1 Tax=Nothobranchius furzeri TaxID=105023 RepID=A0A8C6MD43_NOTFU
MIKAVLIAFLGDNLGSHCIGGFTENFSCSKHFCRYCLVDREGFIKNPLALGPKRTADNYKDSIEILSTTDQSVVNGIKFNSVFNSLKYFHVCSGLPPCLGHDLFEGVVSGDLSLYIDTLVRVEKHFTYNELNRAIAKFKHIGSDALSKPCEVKTGQRLAGSAAQNRCLLRLLPLYIGEKIKDPVDNEVWQLCLKLRDIVELVCAPQISHNDIAYLKIMIEESFCCLPAPFSFFMIFSPYISVMEIEDEITCILPELERQKVLSFADHLKDVISVQQKSDLLLVEADDLKHFLTPIQIRKLLLFGNSEETSTQTIHPPSSTSTSCYHSSSWVSDFQIPWQRFPLRLSQAITSGVRAHPEDRRSMVRIVVEAMQVHCKIPKRSACEEIAKIIVNTHPQTFADFTDKGERLGSGHYSLLRSIKCRVEHVNRDNVTHRLRRPKRTRNEEDCSPERDDTSKVVRRLVDSYGCINWHPVQLPEGETQTSLEEKKNRLLCPSTGYHGMLHSVSLIYLGRSLLTATCWMVSAERHIIFELHSANCFADALSVFFGSFYVLNLEYQEAACATLELIQRFFVRINPEEGTKCTSKFGTSRKTGTSVKRKVVHINPRVTTFLQRLTEFEWKTSN